MTNLLLYFASAFIWGTTWLAIQFQLGDVKPVWSVVYRFAIASAFLIIFCLVKRHSLRFNLRQHLAIALQGTFLFCINYILFYYGSVYFVSGIVAVLFASIIIMNIINSRFIFGTPIAPRVMLGACVGISGLAVIFWSEIIGLNLTRHGDSYVLMGLGINLIATYCSSLGNMTSAANQKHGLPIIQTNALSMAYATVFSFLIAIAMKEPMSFEPTLTYTVSLIYLALFGSVIAFGCYLKLLGRIGPERAAYTFVFIPIIAMCFSTLFENFRWSLHTFVGAALVIFGNILVLMKKKVVTPSFAQSQPPLTSTDSAATDV